MPSIERLTIVGRGAESVMLGPHHDVDSLADMRAVLEALPAREPPTARTLDLLGHSTRDLRVVRLGRDLIDMFDPAVERFFRRLAADRIPQRLDIIALRLLGCATATRPSGQRTMIRLARVLGIPVYGTTKPIMKSHFTLEGFDPTFEPTCLVEAAQLTARRYGDVAA